VLATFKLLEKAVQTGDGNLYLSLQSQKKLEKTDKQAQEQFRKGFAADPSVRYEALDVRTRMITPQCWAKLRIRIVQLPNIIW